MPDFSIKAFKALRLVRRVLTRRTSTGSLLLRAQMARLLVSPNSTRQRFKSQAG